MELEARFSSDEACREFRPYDYAPLSGTPAVLKEILCSDLLSNFCRIFQIYIILHFFRPFVHNRLAKTALEKPVDTAAFGSGHDQHNHSRLWIL